jgi:hypothetical protein
VTTGAGIAGDDSGVDRYHGPVRLRLKHLLRLSRDVVRYSAVNRVWWFIPMMVLLGLIALAVTTTQAAVPVAVYTLF